MTTREFDARASITRPVFLRQDRDRSVIRIGWLLARFIRRQPVRYGVYKRQFDRTEYGYRRDLRVLREARIYRGSELLGSDAS